MQKWGTWRVHICGCTRQAAQLYPGHICLLVVMPDVHINFHFLILVTKVMVIFSNLTGNFVLCATQVRCVT